MVNEQIADTVSSLVGEFIDDNNGNIDDPKYNELHNFRRWIDELEENNG